MSWWINFKKYFVPSEANEHQPHFLREWNIFGLLMIVVLLEGAAVVSSFLFLPQSQLLINSFPDAVVEITNQARQRHSLEPLVLDSQLTAEAQRRVRALALSGGVEAASTSRVAGAGASEYRAVNFFDAADLVSVWRWPDEASRVGVAVVPGVYQGRTALYGVALVSSQSGSAVYSPSGLAPRLNQAFNTAVSVTKLGFWTKAATRPHDWLSIVYTVLLLIALIAFFCNLLIDIHIQHLALIVNGLLLILLLGGLLYINQELFLERIQTSYTQSV